MKKILYILLLIIVLSFCGCSKTELKYINIDEMFAMEEESYYIYFEKDDCPYCEATLATIKDYVNKQSENKNYIPLYICNLSLDENKYLFRKDPSLSGQGNDGKTAVDGATVYEDIYISSTPTLIVIKTEEEKVSYFCASGKTNTIKYIQYYMEK